MYIFYGDSYSRVNCGIYLQLILTEYMVFIKLHVWYQIKCFRILWMINKEMHIVYMCILISCATFCNIPTIIMGKL